MPTSKSQRLVNLVICLMSRERFLSADTIFHTVQGYEESATYEAFLRTFERDKGELERNGVHIEVGETPEATAGYRVRRADIELPPIELTPRAAGVLAVVGEVWSGAARNAELSGALSKLRAAGIRPSLSAPVEIEADTVNSRELALAADFSEFSARDQVATFSHTGVGARAPLVRRLEPWLVGSHDGHWYVVGHDLDRDDVRCFRLSRIADVTSGPRGGATHPRPPIEEVQRILEASVRAFDPIIDARAWVASGAGAVLRSRAQRAVPAERRGVPGDELELTGISVNTATELIAGAGTNAVALAPPRLVDAVVSTLRAAQGATA